MKRRKGGAFGGIVEINVSDSPARRRRKRHAALNDVFQFAHVSRPVKIHQEFQSLRRNLRNGFAGFTRVPLQKIIGERRDIFLVIAQRRNIDGDDVEAVIEILAK